MLLVIDVGNTQTVIGVYSGSDDLTTAEGGLEATWRISTVLDRTGDELASIIDGLFGLIGEDWRKSVSGVAISSGVSSVTASLRRMVARYLKEIVPVVVGPGIKTGLSVLYENPREVGADRIANAVAAYDLFGGPTIVVDFGTATTLDAISAKGEYLGGAIAPGVEISMDALFGRASALSSVELVEPRQVVGKNTAESVQSGVLYGFAGQVDGLCGRFEGQLGDCTILGTGGLAELIAPYTDSIEHVEPWLTLHGLRLIWQKNQ